MTNQVTHHLINQLTNHVTNHRLIMMNQVTHQFRHLTYQPR